MPHPPHLVILGAGFAGLSALRVLAEADDVRVTLVDARDVFEFLPNIHELLSGVKTPAALRLPLAELAERAGATFLQGRVREVDAVARRLVFEDGEALPYDGLVFALGGVNADRGVEGVAEHAHPFKSVADVSRIARELGALEHAGGGPHPVVVVGGGLEGIEALGEILRRDPERARLAPVLVEAGPRLLAELPGAVARSVARHAAEREVPVHTGVPVSAVHADAVVLADGTRLASRCTIWTGGPAPTPVLAASGLAGPGRWLDVPETLQLREHREVFVAGDVAELPRGLARQGYHAIDMGAHAARQLLRHLAGERVRRFRAQEKPSLVAFGDLSTYLCFGPVAIGSRLLAGAKEAVFESVMAQLDGRPALERASAAASRFSLAAEQIVWPVLGSPLALLRATHFELLVGDGGEEAAGAARG